MILGTAAYMSPEQAKGRTVDKRSDVWAFGAVLYEMLTGTRAFAGGDVSEVLASVLAREPDFEVVPATVPAYVRQTLRLCLRKPPKERVPDIGAVRLALEGAFETAAPQPSDVAAMLVAPQPVGWRRALPWLAGIVAASVLTGLAAWNLRAPAPLPVNRFAYNFPDGRVLPDALGHVMALSADGRQFVYSTQDGLYLRAMGELEARLLPGTEESVANPFFSPDGQWVGFFQALQLKKLAISGGAPVIVGEVRAPSRASWGLDDTILFGQAEGVMRVSANGGTPELIIPAEGEQVYGPQLLPDGDAVLFSVTSGEGPTRWDEAQMVVHSLASGERTVLLSGGSDAQYVPTGHLVYAFEDRLFAVGFDVESLAVIGEPVSVVQGISRRVGAAASADYGISQRGTLVYVTGGEGALAPRTLVWVDREGREEPVAAEPRTYLYPRISPDGTRVALDVRDRENDIWIWDVARETPMRLTFDPGVDAYPVWTPDGERMVFYSEREGTPTKLFWKAADGTGAAEPFAEGQGALAAYAFSPDGQRLVVREAHPEQGWNLSVVSLAGDRTLEPLIATPFDERNGELSPEGRWLTYESNASGQFEVYVRPFPVPRQSSMSGSVFRSCPPWACGPQNLMKILVFQRLGALMTPVGCGLTPTAHLLSACRRFRRSRHRRRSPPAATPRRRVPIHPRGSRPSPRP